MIRHTPSTIWHKYYIGTRWLYFMMINLINKMMHIFDKFKWAGTIRYFNIFFIFALFSCNNPKGAIEERDNGCFAELKDSKKIYLVNKSRDKIFQFTCKTTAITNDTVKTYATKIYTLDPGDELYLGCSESLSEQEFGVKKVFKIVENPFYGCFRVHKKDYFYSYVDYGDTVINGKKEKYSYSEETNYQDSLERNHYKFFFEITGEMEQKEHKIKADNKKKN
jgi:hypothetical protein